MSTLDRFIAAVPPPESEEARLAGRTKAIAEQQAMLTKHYIEEYSRMLEKICRSDPAQLKWVFPDCSPAVQIIPLDAMRTRQGMCVTSAV